MGKLCQINLHEVNTDTILINRRNFEIEVSNYLHDFSEQKIVYRYKEINDSSFTGYKSEVGMLSHIDLENNYAEILITNDYVYEHLNDFKLSFYIIIDPIKKCYKLTNPVLVDITKYEI